MTRKEFIYSLYELNLRCDITIEELADFIFRSIDDAYQCGRVDATNKFLEEYLTLPVTLGKNDCDSIMKQVAKEIKGDKK